MPTRSWEMDRSTWPSAPASSATSTSFDGPARAVHCATAIASAIRGIGLEIRAGVHTGEVEFSAGDVRGIAVHIAARVMSLAQPSQVLVSQTVKDLVVGSGLVFEDAGDHELKGVPDRWRLFGVAVPYVGRDRPAAGSVIR